ncbi:rod-binding protein [Novosphingobium sp. BL-8A]|uniref:rod-binding protein n=1 Tax=Novosphingobium sp. BL-8A TaxID=3127639 RepID=UPI0037574E8F
MSDTATASATALGATSSIASASARQTVTAQDKSPAAVARQFEGVFAGQIAKIMLETVEVDDQFGGGHGEEMFRGMMAEQIGNQIAKGKGLGIASAVEAQIIRMQGGNPNASASAASGPAPGAASGGASGVKAYAAQAANVQSGATQTAARQAAAAEAIAAQAGTDLGDSGDAE